MNKQFIMGQEVLFKTELFGKFYAWMRDIDGTIYLVALDDEDRPQFDRMK